MTSIGEECGELSHLTKTKTESKQSETEEDLSPVTWLQLVPHFFCPAIICLGLWLEMHGNFFMIIWIPYVFLPILDYILPVDHYNLSEARARLVEKDRRFLIPLYLTFFLDFGVLFYMLWGINTGRFGNTTSEFILYAICSAQCGALNAIVGHELVH
jgi:hypothetical protein